MSSRPAEAALLVPVSEIKRKEQFEGKGRESIKITHEGLRVKCRRQSSCLCIKSLVQSLATHTAVTSALRNWRQEDENFKSISSYIVGSRQPELHETQYTI